MISHILPNAIAFIHKELTNNHKILVHCKGGINRSPIVVITYLVLYGSFTLKDAIIFVKEKKPSIRIQTHYIEQVESFLSHFKVSTV